MMKRIVKILKFAYSISQSVMLAIGFYFVLLFTVTALNHASLQLVIRAVGYQATVNLDSFTAGFNGVLSVIAFVVFVVGSITTFIFWSWRTVKNVVVRRRKHEIAKSEEIHY